MYAPHVGRTDGGAGVAHPSSDGNWRNVRSRARKFPFPHIARERMLGLLEVQCDKNQMGFAIFYYAARRLGYSARRSARCIVNADEALMTANMINPLCACRSKSATAHSETNTNVRPNTVLR